MALEKNILTTQDLGYGNLVTLDDDTKLSAKVPYELVSDIDTIIPFGGRVTFQAGIKNKITGILAEKILLYAKRKGLPIRLYNKALQNQRNVADAVIDNQVEVASVKAELAEMKALLAEKDIEKTSEKVIKKSVPRKKKATKSKAE